jgi:pimeloyl-ACP methyl ester carboxylesterase
MALAETTLAKKMITHHTILYQGIQLHYRKVGVGAATLLIHGFGEDGNVFNQAIKHLPEQGMLLIPDLPGSGESEIWPAAEPSLNDFALALNAILEIEGIEKCRVMGHSMGGYIALAFAEQFPEKIVALSLLHSTAYADSAERIQKRKQAIDFIEREGAAAFLRISLPGLFAPTFREQGKAAIDALLTSMKQVSGTTLIQYYRAMMQRPDRSNLLKAAPYPVMFIIGQEDEIVQPADTLQLADITANAYIHVLDNVGHMSMLEAPESFASLLITFMQL